MLLQLILFIISATSLATLGLIINNIIKSRLAYWSFVKKSNNLPMMHDCQLIGNHVNLMRKKNLCNEVMQNHAKLGKTFGWLINEKYAVNTTDLDLIKLIIQDGPNKHVNRTTLNVPMREMERSLMMAEDDDWRKLRRHFAPAFKSAKFKTPNVIGEIESSIKKLIDQIDLELDQRKVDLDSESESASGGKEFEADELVHKYSLDLVFSCFYKQYNLIDFNDDNCNWTKLVDEGVRACQTSTFIRISMTFPVLKHAIDWFSWHFHPQGKWRQSIMNFVKLQTKLGLEARKQAQQLQSNMKQGEKLDMDNFELEDGTKFRRNMIDHVIDHFLDGKLTKDEFFDTSCFLVGAADKTASDAIVHTLYLLGRHQDVQEKLRKAIQVDGIDAEYLAWVLNESLRLQPPAPLGCSRTITRDIPLADGKMVPANTLVVTPVYTIHRLKEYWGEDAEEFRPERWQDTSHFHPMQYIPFGAGNRGCPGKEFALFEMKMLFTALLSRYKFECKHKDDAYSFDSPCLTIIIPSSPTYIRIKRLQIASQRTTDSGRSNVDPNPSC